MRLEGRLQDGAIEFDDPHDPGGYLEVVRRDTADFKTTDHPDRNIARSGYTPETLEIARAMQTVHKRTETPVGAEDLARTVYDKDGTFYIGNYYSAGEQPEREFAGYAYLEHGERADDTLHISELEVTRDVVKGDDPEAVAAHNHWVAAGLIGAVIFDDPEAHSQIRVDGRHEIPETRDPTYFTGIGFEAKGGAWTEPGAYMEGHLPPVVSLLSHRYDIYWQPSSEAQ